MQKHPKPHVHANSTYTTYTIPSPTSPQFQFNGSGSTLLPHHMTRYIYPSNLHYHASQLVLQLPSDSVNRVQLPGRRIMGC
ncbi:unnamed protein product [Periconia digitata]|uniref:Uncharacterized protein n=1 Tax=Periconia digitata TaxID=1303443 RepID=A0A9W4U525_9PLEO|nr:unnamed protein product [Periconia digitata]